MKVLQIVPRSDAVGGLKALLKAKERELRGSRTTFVRAGEGRWAHKKYPGRVAWAQGLGGVLLVEIKTPAETEDWQLLQSFVGYLDRHFREVIDSLSIIYRHDTAKPRRRKRARARRRRVTRRPKRRAAKRRAVKRRAVKRRAVKRRAVKRRPAKRRKTTAGKSKRGRSRTRPRRRTSRRSSPR